jgi:CheY-like chemotaxis protein
MPAEKILVVDDEQSMTQFLGIVLRKEGFQVTTCNNGKEALERVKSEPFDVVITDIKMPGMDGIQLLTGIKKHDPSLPVVIMTAYASQQSAIDAVNMGAFQYLIKNAKNDEIKLIVRNALEMRKVRTENQFLKRELKKGHEEKAIIGSSEEMVKVFKMVDKVAGAAPSHQKAASAGADRANHYRKARVGRSVASTAGYPRPAREQPVRHVKGSFTERCATRDCSRWPRAGCPSGSATCPSPRRKRLRAPEAPRSSRRRHPTGQDRCRLVAATNADLEKESRRVGSAPTSSIAERDPDQVAGATPAS